MGWVIKDVKLTCPETLNRQLLLRVSRLSANGERNSSGLSEPCSRGNSYGIKQKEARISESKLYSRGSSDGDNVCRVNIYFGEIRFSAGRVSQRTFFPGNFCGGATGRAFPQRKGAFSIGGFPPRRNTFSGRAPLRGFLLLGKVPQGTMETKRLSTTLPRASAISLNFMISGSYQKEMTPRGGKTP